MTKCAFEHGEYCDALTAKNCERCSFRKTQDELDAGRKKALCRLYMLPSGKLRKITSKYYKGMRLFGNA